MLIAALLSPQEAGGDLAQRASSGSVAFFFTVSIGLSTNQDTSLMQPVHVVLRCHHELCAMGVCTRDSSTPRTSQRHSGCHQLKLDLELCKSPSCTSVGRRLTAQVVVMITPTLIGQLQWQAYLIFMATNLSFVPILYFFYPETTNLTLEEIDYLFLEEHVVKHSKEIWKKGLSADERRRIREAGLESGGTVVAKETQQDEGEHDENHKARTEKV